MIHVDTADPDQPYTWAPRLAAPLRLERCGVVQQEWPYGLYQNLPAIFDDASIALALDPQPLPSLIGHGCWIEYPLGSDTWYPSTIRDVLFKQVTCDPVSAIPNNSLEDVALKIVKFWTDV